MPYSDETGKRLLFCDPYLEGVVSQVLVAVAVHDGVEDGAGHPDQVAADVDRDHSLAVHALRKSNHPISDSLT